MLCCLIVVERRCLLFFSFCSFIFFLFCFFCFYFFFFQAEDGIRDTSVTGVQTCALPILGGLHYLAIQKRALKLECSRSLMDSMAFSHSSKGQILAGPEQKMLSE